MRPTRRALGLFAVMLAGLALTPDPGMAEPLKLRLSSETPPTPGHPHLLALFRDELKARLGDEVDIEYFDSGVLGNEQVHLDQVRTGQIDAYIIGSDAASLDEKWNVFEMPFLFSDSTTAEKFLDGEFGAEMKASMREGTGLQVLSFGTLGMRQFTTSVRPIVKPEDFKGLKIRVPGSQVRMKLFSTLGAAPVTIPVGEVYLALDNGTADGQEQGLSSLRIRSLNEVQKYLSLANYIYTPMTLVMNGRRYDGLTDAQKAAVNDAAAAAAKINRENIIKFDEEILASVKGQMEINTIDLESFRAAVRPFWDEVAETVGKDFADRAIASVTAPAN